MIRASVVVVSGLMTLCTLDTSAVADTVLGQAVASIGITPTALAACCTNAQEAAQILSTISGSAELATFVTTRTALNAAQSAFDETMRIADPLEVDGMAAIEAATSLLTQAKSNFESARVALADVAINSQGESTQSRLRAWRQTPADLPAECRIIAWTQQELDLLRQSLLHEVLAGRGELALPPNEELWLQQVRSRSETVQAATRVQLQLESMAALLQASTQ